MISSKEDEIMEALREVIDPEIGLNVVELGLIRNLELDDEGKAPIGKNTPTPSRPYAPQPIQQGRQATNTVTGGGTEVDSGRELRAPLLREEGAGGDWGLF